MGLSIGLVTLNAKFIHSSLSLRYLRNAARTAGYGDVWIEEFTIGQPVWKIAAEILKRQPDLVGISIYIWNRTQSFQLIELLEKQNPDLAIVIGGPEVSFEPDQPTQYITIAGEGENKWVECLGYKSRNKTPPPEVLQRWNTFGVDLPDLQPAYLEEDLPAIKNRLVYLETSRGCPYHCSFCLSALDKTVRYFDDTVVRDQIEKLAAHEPLAIKFVDRTFNLNTQRAMALLKWLTRFEGTSFHFEVVGDILNDEMLAFLDTLPAGMVQFEIGIQTAVEESQSIIHRKQNNELLFKNIRRLKAGGKIHIHADLIFGLPGETLDMTLQSFTEVFSLRPHELQLGFLKFLPGAPIHEVIASHQYKFQSFPPYELIGHKDLSPAELNYLKQFVMVFDIFYNTHRFGFSLDLQLAHRNPVDLFDHLLKYMEEKGLTRNPISMDAQYQVFHDAFALKEDPLAMDLLRLDYLYHQRVFHLPRFMQSHFPPDTKTRLKAWRGDGKTPLMPFMHEISLEGAKARLTPVAEPVYYAVVHQEKNSRYIRPPAIVAAEG